MSVLRLGASGQRGGAPRQRTRSLQAAQVSGEATARNRTEPKVSRRLLALERLTVEEVTLEPGAEWRGGDAPLETEGRARWAGSGESQVPGAGTPAACLADRKEPT